MSKSKIQDERILAERRKIQSTGYSLIVYVLLISIIVQQFFMKAPFAQYAVEFFLLIGCGLYNMISNYKKGIDLWNPARTGKKKLLLNTLASAIVSGIASLFLFAFLSGENNNINLILFFVSFTIFFFAFHIIMAGINYKKQQAIDKELNDDDIL